MAIAASLNIAVASADGTLSACLQDNGQLMQGALGEQPLRGCNERSTAIQLQTGRVITFNLEVPSDDAWRTLIEEDEFGLDIVCDEHLRPFLSVIAKIDIILFEKVIVIRDVGGGTQYETVRSIPQGSQRTFEFTGNERYSWLTGELISTTHQTYATLSAFLRIAHPDGCIFSGEVRLVDLPELEAID